MVKEKSLTFNSRNSEENNKWFEKLFSKKIKIVSLYLIRKEGEEINPKSILYMLFLVINYNHKITTIFLSFFLRTFYNRKIKSIATVS